MNYNNIAIRVNTWQEKLVAMSVLSCLSGVPVSSGTFQETLEKKSIHGYSLVGMSTKLTSLTSKEAQLHIDGVCRADKVIDIKDLYTLFESRKIEVQLSQDYKAEITNQGVKVGCQTFSFEKIDELNAAIDDFNQ